MILGLRSNGTWLHGLAPVGDLRYSFAWSGTGGGLLTVEWSMALPRGYSHPALRKDALVELMAGPVTLGWASLTEPDRDEWRFTADGLYRMGERMAAVDGANEPSTNISAIVTAAAARGWPWRNAGDLPSAALSTDSESSFNSNYASDVLNEYCRINGKRWCIDAERYVRIGDDPTAISWALTPGTPGMAVADDDYASRLFGRYVTALNTEGQPSAWGATTVVDSAAADRWGQSEHIVDQTPLGLISSPDSAAALSAMLAAGRARPAFTQAVELVRGQVTTPGGTSPELWQVAAAVGSGMKVRHHGVLDSEGAAAFGGTLEWVAGSASHDVAGRRLTLAPVGLAARTLSQVLAVQAPRTEFS